MTANIDQYQGCLLGLALGDALGAPYEGGILERALWAIVGRSKGRLPRWTDDTQMSLDLAHSLLHCGGLDQDDLARRFADSYRWSRGYGPSAARVLKRIRGGENWAVASKKIYKSGSFGNGAAMRASVLALFFVGSRAELLEAARKSAEITHAHPLGIAGAVLIAVAARCLLARQSTAQIFAELSATCEAPQLCKRLEIAADWLDKQAQPSAKEVARTLGNGITAETSCVTALYIALRFLSADFKAMLAFTIACGGDVDTIAAMAGTLWGAFNGGAALPSVEIEQRAEIGQIAVRLHEYAVSAGGA